MRRVASFAYRMSVQWLAHDNTPAAAALAFYTIFSLSPLVIIAVVIAGWVFGPGPAEQAVTAWLEQQIGVDAARVVKTVLASGNPYTPPMTPTSVPSAFEPVYAPAPMPTAQRALATTSSVLATTLGVLVLVYGASLVFVQLHATLNRVMGTEIAADAHTRTHILGFLRGRLVSIVFTLGVGALILITVTVNTALAAVGRQAESLFGPKIDTVRALGPLASFLLITGAFYLLLRFLPHGRARWRETLIGALVAALLFEIGKYLIALYLGRSGVASAYGAGGTIVAVLLWVYYSAHTFLFGAEIVRWFLDRRAAPSTG